MRLIETQSPTSAVAEIDGVRRCVNTTLVESPQLGDYLIVHAGFAIEILDREEAEQRLLLISDLIRRTAEREKMQ